MGTIATTVLQLLQNGLILSLPVPGMKAASPPDPRCADGGYMTATVTLPAPPEPHLGTGLLPATRHRAVAVGWGLGGLIATKALKHHLANITDALVFLTRITAQAKSHVHSQTSLWLQVVPPTAAALTTIGVLIAVYAAIISERKKAERRTYEMATAAEYFSYDGRLGLSQRTPKGWC